VPVWSGLSRSLITAVGLFSTYAVWWIRRSIHEAIASANVIRIPTKANQQLAAVRRAEADLRRIGPRRASDAAIAEHTQLSETTVRSLRAAARVTASLDEPVGEDTTPLGDLVADERVVDPSASGSRARAVTRSRRRCDCCRSATEKSSPVDTA
jgi:DNA-directed RNA polymerase sigma subunit (sigma70/sigma32)